MRVYVLTDKGWIDEDDIFTSVTKKIKADAKAMPIEVTNEKNVELKRELPMVVVRNNYYFIQSVN